MCKRVSQEESVAATTFYRGMVRVPPAALRAVFGEPDAGPADRKTTGEYWFQDDSGGTFSLYDYKQTSAYDAILRTPEEFWNDEKAVEIHVGANAEADLGAFLAWLKKQVPGIEVAERIGG